MFTRFKVAFYNKPRPLNRNSKVEVRVVCRAIKCRLPHTLIVRLAHLSKKYIVCYSDEIDRFVLQNAGCNGVGITVQRVVEALAQRALRRKRVCLRISLVLLCLRDILWKWLRLPCICINRWPRHVIIVQRWIDAVMFGRGRCTKRSTRTNRHVCLLNLNAHSL